VRDHRLDHRHQRRCIDVPQLDHPRDVFVTTYFGGQLRFGQRRVRAHIARGNNLYGLAGLDGGEAFNLQRRLKRLVRFFGRHLGRRDNGYLAAHALIDDEVLAGNFTDEFGQHGDVHVLEIHRDLVLRDGWVVIRPDCPSGRANQERCCKQQSCRMVAVHPKHLRS
jgi:hypothetical protein